MPACNFIRIVSRQSGSALALTSANLSGQPSSVCIKDFKNLWEHCAYVFDGGELPMGRAGSTVVDLTVHRIYKILRPVREKKLLLFCKSMVSKKRGLTLDDLHMLISWIVAINFPSIKSVREFGPSWMGCFPLL